ncbi:c-type cytochrome [Massilia sp. TN1-12]|uniref:c-type cytochrome n=1 Tax=Massilia paldalensis TaxID=3377675 RepID=UPI00384B3A35
MKRTLVLVPLALAACAAAAYAFLNRSDPSPGTAPVLHGAPPSAALVARGAYLARAADCVACHTAPGGKPFAGGLAFKLPFGTLYASNITPDRDTGIGAWSDDDFVRAMHDGIRKDGKRLYPAFPYTSYSQLSRDDALAIKAYLFSLPATHQATPEPDLAFPFNQRWAMGFWNAAFFRSARFAPAPDRSPEWNRGAYLATALAHCAECHTPRNIGFALDHGKELGGAVVDGWLAPNITPDPVHGIGGWTDAQLYQYLRLGHTPGRGSAGGPMGEAVENSLQYLDHEDTRALIVYLRSIAPRTDGPAGGAGTGRATGSAAVGAAAYGPAADTPAQLRAGLRLFEGSCASCHQWNGTGPQSEYAALAGARSVHDPSGRNIVQTLLHGAHLRIGTQDVFMPAFRTLSDAEIAQVSNYVIHQFGGRQGAVTAETVAAQRKQ